MERIDYRKLGRAGFELLGQLSQLGKKSSLGLVLNAPQSACLPDQPLHALREPTCEHVAKGGAERGAHPERRSLGGGDMLHRAGEGGAGMDRGRDAGSRYRRAGRRL